MSCGERRTLDAINVPNRGAMPGLEEDAVVEVPAVADNGKLQIKPLARLPEAMLAMLRTQGSIRKLGVEAYQEQSKSKLVQAVLLEPTCRSYRQAIAMVDRMLDLQKDILPVLK
jgi:alpha-galactosidase